MKYHDIKLQADVIPSLVTIAVVDAKNEVRNGMDGTPLISYRRSTSRVS
jgi:hypothetical protein